MVAEGEVVGVDAALVVWGEYRDGAGGGGALEKREEKREEADAGIVAKGHEGVYTLWGF
jgi:hypothetical protein